MRLILTAIAMLMLFTANQVAMAYEHCDDAGCVFFAGDTHKDQDKKAEKSPEHHCCGSAVFFAPVTKQLSGNLVEKDGWNLVQQFSSVAPPILIEPPTSL